MTPLLLELDLQEQGLSEEELAAMERGEAYDVPEPPPPGPEVVSRKHGKGPEEVESVEVDLAEDAEQSVADKLHAKRRRQLRQILRKVFRGPLADGEKQRQAFEDLGITTREQAVALRVKLNLVVKHVKNDDELNKFAFIDRSLRRRFGDPGPPPIVGHSERVPPPRPPLKYDS